MVYTLRYSNDNQGSVLKHSFVSSASFEQALRSAIDKVHRQHPSEKLTIKSFVAEPGEEVPDEVADEQ